MNQDDFLYKYREEPKESFRLALKKQLTAESPNVSDHLMSSQVSFWQRRRAQLAFGVTLLIFLGFLFTPIGANQTLAQAVQTWIAGLAFIETDSLPTEKPLRENEIVIQQTPQTSQIDLTEAQAVIPFLMPEWVPDGYELSAVTLREGGKETALKEDDVSEVRVNWNTGEEWIAWDAVDREIPMLVYDAKYVEEIEVAGEAVAKVRGGWNSETNEYGFLDLITYSWEINGVFYNLSGYESALSDEDAISMIRSVIE